jgi:hypothetical protein
MESNDLCSICCEKKDNPIKLPKCNHEFCKDCIEQWFRVKPVCPICRNGDLEAANTRESAVNHNYGTIANLHPSASVRLMNRIERVANNSTQENSAWNISTSILTSGPSIVFLIFNIILTLALLIPSITEKNARDILNAYILIPITWALYGLFFILCYCGHSRRH